MELYKEYLLAIRDSLIRCGVGLPVKDKEDYSYEELFYLSEEIDQILWYYSILAIVNSRNKLKGFIFPLDTTYLSKMRSIFYAEYCDVQKDYSGISVESLQAKEEGVDNRFVEEGDEKDIFDFFGEEENEEEGSSDDVSKDFSEDVDTGNEFSEDVNLAKDNDLEDVDIDSLWDDTQQGDNQKEEEEVIGGNVDEDGWITEDGVNRVTKEELELSKEGKIAKSSSFNPQKESTEEGKGNTYITEDMLSIDDKGFFVYDGDEVDEEVEKGNVDFEDIDPFEDDEREGYDVDDSDFPSNDDTEDDDIDFPDIEEDDEDEEEDVDFPDREEDDEDVDEDVNFPDWGENNSDDKDNVEDEEDVDFPDWGEDEDEYQEESSGIEDIDDIDDDDFPDLDDDNSGVIDEGDDDVDFPDWDENEEDDNNSTDILDDDGDVDFPDWDEDEEDEEVKEDIDDGVDFPDWEEDETDVEIQKPQKKPPQGNIQSQSIPQRYPQGSQERHQMGNPQNNRVKPVRKKDPDEAMAEAIGGFVTGLFKSGKKSGKKVMSRLLKDEDS